MLKNTPGAILLITTNPVVVMTNIAAHIGKRSSIHQNRIIGGTGIDSIFLPPVNDNGTKDLNRSAQLIRNKIDKLNINQLLHNKKR